MTKLFCHWWKPEATHIRFWTYSHTAPQPWAAALWREWGSFLRSGDGTKSTMGMSQSAWAAVPKYPRLGSLTNRHFFPLF